MKLQRVASAAIHKTDTFAHGIFKTGNSNLAKACQCPVHPPELQSFIAEVFPFVFRVGLDRALARFPVDWTNYTMLISELKSLHQT